jgi:hypothetical protein
MGAQQKPRGARLLERLSLGRPGKQEHNLFSVLGDKPGGHTMALISAATEAESEYCALHELGFVVVSMTSLVSDCVYVGLPA